MKKSDFVKVGILGLLIGLLIQPILSNIVSTQLIVPLRVGIVVGFALFAMLALAVAYMIDRVMRGTYQFAQFAAVGTLNTFVDIGIFNLLVLFFGLPYGGGSMFNTGFFLFPIYKGVSFLCGTTNSFFWNKYWTFRSGDDAKAGQVASFYAVAIGGVILNVAAATFINTLRPAGLSGTMMKIWTSLIAPGSGVAVSFIWNFLWYKYVIFKKKTPVIVVGG